MGNRPTSRFPDEHFLWRVTPLTVSEADQYHNRLGIQRVLEQFEVH